MGDHHEHTDSCDHDSGKKRRLVQGHHHGHSHHGHHHHHHDHGVAATRGIAVALLLNFVFTLVEIVGSYFTGSVAILADAIHDLGDTVSLSLAFILQRVSLRKRTQAYTYGYGRFSLLSALISGMVIWTGSIVIFYEAIPRLLHPGEAPFGWGMVGLALIGVAVNLGAYLRLRKGETQVESALSWHFIEDVLGWVAVLIGGVIVAFTHWTWVDPLLAILVAIFVLWNVSRNLMQTITLFLQGTPAGFSEENFRTTVRSIKGIKDIHDLHVWSLDGAQNVLSMHLVVEVDPSDTDSLNQIKRSVRRESEKYGRYHTTIEVEFDKDACVVNCDHQAQE